MHVEPSAVGTSKLRGLRFEHARERDTPAAPGASREQGRENDQWLGEDVGDHEVIGGGFQRFGERHANRYAVGRGILLRGRYRLRIDVGGIDSRRPEPGRRDGQYTGAATVIEDALAAPDARLQKPQDQAGRGMTPRAECESGIQAHGEPARWRLVPARADPEAPADRHRRELRLRAPHPVLVFDLRYRETRPGRLFRSYWVGAQQNNEWNLAFDRQVLSYGAYTSQTWNNFWTSQVSYTLRDRAQARYDLLSSVLKLKAAAGALSEQDIAEVDTFLEPQGSSR